MARSRGRSAPAPARQQSRSNHTMAAPRQAPAPAPVQHAPAQQSQGPGLFGQMASTAAGVAVGSAVGHTIANGIGGFFGGGSREAPVDQYQQQQVPQTYQSSSWDQTTQSKCDVDARNLTQCMDQNNGDMRVCQWYMDQLKGCLGASSSA